MWVVRSRGSSTHRRLGTLGSSARPTGYGRGVPDHALELSFDAADDSAVVARWNLLRDAGLPSQADHRSMTNAPHLTIVAAQPITPATLDLARDIVLPLLPATVLVRGLVVLGQGARVALAYLAEPDSRLAQAAHQVRESVPNLRHPVWTPHITLARRLPRRLVPDALRLLVEHPLTEITATRLRWWDPELDVVDEITPVSDDGT